ncbi:MmcQ/YjbR family DNA-binding protein [Aerococcaceae bacterium zg-B36]|uniref:MmcQ/YjbR family DNA-binding protein n=1 Tax=Aerococcaceae bacterium zg-252 TaxID=2796928 RepID=UPI001BD8B1C3|nr:MmcQ/YjbR family DNA-binding protein [Aerococcaceae bacterium zg-B36]
MMFTKQLRLSDFDNEVWQSKGFDVQENFVRKKLQFDEAPQLSVNITVTQTGTSIEVIDLQFDDVWLPFYQTNHSNAERIKELIQQQLLEWLTNEHMTQERMESLLKQQFPQAQIERPWEKSPNFSTFKINGSWFALYTEISGEKIGLDTKENVSVLNIKLPPETIEARIDYHTFFPAYHMNKKHWLSIYLRENTISEAIMSMIQQSYHLVSH